MKAAAERVLWVLGSRQVGAGREGAARLVARQDDGTDLVVVGRLVGIAEQAVVVVLSPTSAGLGAARRQDAGVALLAVEKHWNRCLSMPQAAKMTVVRGSGPAPTGEARHRLPPDASPKSGYLCG